MQARDGHFIMADRTTGEGWVHVSSEFNNFELYLRNLKAL